MNDRAYRTSQVEAEPDLQLITSQSSRRRGGSTGQEKVTSPWLISPCLRLSISTSSPRSLGHSLSSSYSYFSTILPSFPALNRRHRTDFPQTTCPRRCSQDLLPHNGRSYSPVLRAPVAHRSEYPPPTAHPDQGPVDRCLSEGFHADCRSREASPGRRTDAGYGELLLILSTGA